MARLLGPDAGSRPVLLRGVLGVMRSAGGLPATIYADAAGTTLADIATYDPLAPTTPGAAITGSKVIIDGQSSLPLFWFPDGVDKLYRQVDGGPLIAINADYDARLDAGGGGGGGNSGVPTKTVTFSSSITIDASQGNQFRFTATSAFTLNAPTGGYDGQTIVIAIKQDPTGGRVMTLGTGIHFGTDLTAAVLSTAGGARDKLCLQYDAPTSGWDVNAFLRGF